MSGIVNRLSSNVRLTSVGQNGKYRARADAFRFASKFGHCSMRSALCVCARNRHCYRSVTQARLLAAEVEVVGHLYNYFFLVVFLIGIAIVFLASEFGWRLGTRTKGQAASGNISALEQSLLGLLALIVGFTFLMALTRFEARREAVLNEANAIGTTALRARLLPEPHRTESLKLLREYAQIRIDYIPTGKSFAELPTLIDRSNNIQEALWQQVKALSAKDNNMVPTGLFIQALNEMIDNQGKRLSALRNYIPDVVLLSLFGIAAVACGFAGYASGLDPLRTRLPVFITAFLVCSVIFVILDLDRPNVGFITISQQPMIDTVASLSAFNE